MCYTTRMTEIKTSTLPQKAPANGAAAQQPETPETPETVDTSARVGRGRRQVAVTTAKLPQEAAAAADTPTPDPAPTRAKRARKKRAPAADKPPMTYTEEHYAAYGHLLCEARDADMPLAAYVEGLRMRVLAYTLFGD